MSRERMRDMIEDTAGVGTYTATKILDAILPQVTTVEELDSLPGKAILLSTPAGEGFLPVLLLWVGGDLRYTDFGYVFEPGVREFLRLGPLTVVWTQ